MSRLEFSETLFEFLNPTESSSVSITSSILCLYHFLFTSLLHFLYSSHLFSVSSILSLVVILFLCQLPTLRNYMGHRLPSFFSPHIQHIPSTSLYQPFIWCSLVLSTSFCMVIVIPNQFLSINPNTFHLQLHRLLQNTYHRILYSSVHFLC